MLRIYKPCNSILRFSKYKFNNKLLSNVNVTLLIQCNIGVSVIEIIYKYIYRERERERVPAEVLGVPAEVLFAFPCTT